MKRVASIDIGSNTTLLLIVEQGDKSGVAVLHDESTVTGLGRGVRKTLEFSDEAIEETCNCLKSYAITLDSYDLSPADVVVTATEASRLAKNSAKLFDRVKTELGFDVKIITASQEAYYTSLGVCLFDPMIDRSTFTIMDIGGASTELIRVLRNPHKVVTTVSYPIGSVVAQEWFEAGCFDDKFAEIISDKMAREFCSEFIVCVAGSMTSLGGMIKGLSEFDAKLVNGATVRYNEYTKFVNELSLLELKELQLKYPFLGKRAETIVAGAKVGEAFAKELGVREFRISTYGLRHGTAGERLNV